MIRDITIGQYYPADSPLHRMDARVKIIITLLYIISLFVIKSFIGYAFVILCLAAVIKISKVPFRFMVKGLKALIFIIVFTAVINLFTTKGDTVLFTVWRFTATLEGLFFAIKMCLRIVLLIIGSSLLTLTTTPIKLTDGIESLLKPFAKIGVPAHDIAMMMTIALRFIPTLLDETDKIIKAQQARGADFDTGSPSGEEDCRDCSADSSQEERPLCHDCGTVLIRQDHIFPSSVSPAGGHRLKAPSHCGGQLFCEPCGQPQG
mgnify:CR=1 FL=1